MTIRKIFAYRAVLLASPLLLLLAGEGMFRLLGYGGYPPNFLELGPREKGTVVVSHPPGSISYFHANRFNPGSNREYAFYTPKPPGTTRIFLAGGSAAKGFPQGRRLAASAFLEAMLSDVWPGRRVEVINLGTTAAASFPVMDMVIDALAYDPDLVVVYAGNNEFFGSYGVASRHVSGSRPGALRFRRNLHRTALAQGVIDRAWPRRQEAPKTIMEGIIARTHITADDPLRVRAVRNFRAHLDRTIRACRTAEAPIIVCTLPCNESGLAPMGVDALTALDPGERDRVRDLVDRAEGLRDGEPRAARRLLSDALTIKPDYARAHYQLGLTHNQLGDKELCAIHLSRAVDLDPLPWRAPAVINDTIKQVASARGVVVCDLQKVFRDHSPGGVVGWELMDDHVHPSLEGQARVARAIVESMGRIEGAVRIPEGRAKRLLSGEAYAERLGANPYEAYRVARVVEEIFRASFLQRSNPDAVRRVTYRVSQAASVLDMPAAAIGDRHGSHDGVVQAAADWLMARGRYREAERLYRFAFHAARPYAVQRRVCAYLMLRCKQLSGTPLSDGDRELIAEEIQRGLFRLRVGSPSSGKTEHSLEKLRELMGTGTSRPALTD